MPVIEPGTYDYVTLDKLVVTDEGDMILHIRVRAESGYAIIHHHMGQAPLTSGENWQQICVEYLSMKFPAYHVGAFVQGHPNLDWETYVDKEAMASGASGAYMTDLLDTYKLAEDFRAWLRGQVAP